MRDILAAIMADPNVSPDLQRVLGAPTDGMVRTQRRKAYADALQRMDWGFEQADDHSVWKRWNTELCRLRDERAEIDPNGLIWDMFAPESYRYSKVLA